MSKRQRIAALEAKVIELEARLGSMEARPQWLWTQPVSPLWSPSYIGDTAPRRLSPDITFTYPGGNQ